MAGDIDGLPFASFVLVALVNQAITYLPLDRKSLGSAAIMTSVASNLHNRSMPVRQGRRNRFFGLLRGAFSTRTFSPLLDFEQALGDALLRSAATGLVKDGPAQAVRKALHRV